MAECTAKNEFRQGNTSAAGSSTLGKCSFHLEKESSPAPNPMVAENASARIDNDENKNPSKRRGGPYVCRDVKRRVGRNPHKKLGGPQIFRTFTRSDAGEWTDNDMEGVYLVKDFSRAIFHLDLWNRPIYARLKAEIAANPDHPEAIRTRDDLLREEKNRPRLDAESLTALRPNYVPVAVEKDPSSDLPEIHGNLFHVPGDVTLDEFLERAEVNLSAPLDEGQLMYGYFKKTQFPNDALMSEIYKENVDEDGYLRMIYSGELKQSVN